jgi:two-component system, LytTR family, response regulator
MKIQCVAVDDNERALETIQKATTKIDYLELMAVFTSPIQACEAIKTLRPDLVFVDIDMPEFSGIELIKRIKQDNSLSIHIIITSSHVQYGKDGFDLRVTDFLLKPFTIYRFREAMNEVYTKLQLKAARTAFPDTALHGTLAVKSAKTGLYEQIYLEDINYLSVKGNYTYVHVGHKIYPIYNSLHKIVNTLPNKYFLRIHDATAIAIHKIDRYRGGIITLNNQQQFKVGRAYKATVDQVLGKKLV